jgi:hypothetical protein
LRRDYIECNGHLFQRSDFRALFASAARRTRIAVGGGANSVDVRSNIIGKVCLLPCLPAIEEETCDIKCETLHEKKTHKLSSGLLRIPHLNNTSIYMSASPETSFYTLSISCENENPSLDVQK